MSYNMETFIQLRRALHQIPEPGFKEFKTQQLILSYLSTLPSERLEIETWRTGILVKVSGTNPSIRIGYRTDMDGLPISENTSYAFQSNHEGFMHACGHDIHMAITLGILTHFAHNPHQDDLIFIFEPAEEGPGGALPMMASAQFQKWKPDLIMALHIAPDYPVGTIATRPGILFANTSELFVDLYGTGGHAARPHQANDMVIATSHLATQLQTIVSRNVDPLDSVIVTIGKMTAGTKQNIIADHGRLEGTIRTLTLAAMEKVKARIQSMVEATAIGYHCKTEIDWGCSYCQVENHVKPTQHFMHWAQAQPDINLVECSVAMTGEDFGYFLREIPGFMFWLGVDTPYGLHHPQIEPNEKAIAVAIQTMCNYISEIRQSDS
ncbi:N-acetyldiaminopimelate deacetylase [Polycladospora coralii]|uniref:N-acetyldiaminopimelate deacetylase n=1 Tax=Polycladospora coralii TaxID=2771432 RepID=UPI003D30101C